MVPFLSAIQAKQFFALETARLAQNRFLYPDSFYLLVYFYGVIQEMLEQPFKS
jgi:hypothetical protein